MSSVLYMVSKPSLVASMRIEDRNAIWDELDLLNAACTNSISGPLFLMYEPQRIDKLKELCYPVIKQINEIAVKTKIIGRCEVYSVFHFGSISNLDIVVFSFIESYANRIDISDMLVKEIFHEFYPDNEEENVTEIQLLFPLEHE